MQDLLLHLPLRYEIAPISTPSENYCRAFMPRWRRSAELQYLLRRSADDDLPDSDGSGILTMRFFNFNAAMKKAWRRAAVYWPMAKQSAANMGRDDPPGIPRAGRSQYARVAETLTPVYPTTEGVKQATLRN